MRDAELRTWCRENWRRVPEDKRELCVNHLTGWMPPSYLAEWKAKGGFPMLAHTIGGGMQIRNKLREVLEDKDLPKIRQSKGGAWSQNWDDFYTGCLDEMMERLP